MDILDYKPKIIAILSALFPQAKIILYGSRARGTQKEGVLEIRRESVQKAVEKFGETVHRFQQEDASCIHYDE